MNPTRISLSTWVEINNPQCWDDWNHDCTRYSRGIVRRQYSNGAVMYVEQCGLCGRQIRPVKKIDIGSPVVAEWDPAINEAWMATQERIHREVREQRRSAWWRRYDEYLASPEWQELRSRTLKRSNGVCEGCGLEAASDIHHKTYANFGREFLFELLALCRGCHQRFHNQEKQVDHLNI